MRMAVEVAMLIASLVLGALTVRHWRRARQPVLRRMGMAFNRFAAADLLAGLFIAAAAMALIFVTERAVGGLHSVRDAAASFPAAQLARMTLTALKEEILWRSFLLCGLIILFDGRWKIALGLSAIAFGLIHLSNPSASTLSVIGNALGGLMYGLAFVRTGTLWLPFGLHLGWNFVQGPILGLPVSGFDEGGLFKASDLGSALLTGGTYGPEGGLIGIGARFVVIAAVLAWTRSRIGGEQIGLQERPPRLDGLGTGEAARG